MMYNNLPDHLKQSPDHTAAVLEHSGQYPQQQGFHTSIPSYCNGNQYHPYPVPQHYSHPVPHAAGMQFPGPNQNDANFCGMINLHMEYLQGNQQGYPGQYQLHHHATGYHNVPPTHHSPHSVGSDLSSGNDNNGSVSPPMPENSPSSNSSNRGIPSRSPFDWMKRNNNYTTQPQPGKTRTKDKYRVVYTDNQRMELEKEFYYSRYITIRRKTELAQTLGLSERQVKIWFQNRRAKERKIVKKREETRQDLYITPDQHVPMYSASVVPTV